MNYNHDVQMLEEQYSQVIKEELAYTKASDLLDMILKTTKLQPVSTEGGFGVHSDVQGMNAIVEFGGQKYVISIKPHRG